MEAVTELRKDFIIKDFFPWNLGNFSEQVFFRTTFGECFCFGSPIKTEVFSSPNKETPLQVVKAT